MCSSPAVGNSSPGRIPGVWSSYAWPAAQGRERHIRNACCALQLLAGDKPGKAPLAHTSRTGGTSEGSRCIFSYFFTRINMKSSLCILVTIYISFLTLFFPPHLYDGVKLSHLIGKGFGEPFPLWGKWSTPAVLSRLVNISVLLCSLSVPENFVRQSTVIDSRETKHHFLLFSVSSHPVALIPDFFPTNSRIHALVYQQLFKINWK